MLCNITQNAMGRHLGGVPISNNALQHYPEFHGADTWGGVPGQVQPGGVPCQGDTLLGEGTLPGGTLLGGYPAKEGTLLGGTLPEGDPVRTTEGVLTTRQAVCLLRSRRRTFLFCVSLDLSDNLREMHQISLS